MNRLTSVAAGLIILLILSYLLLVGKPLLMPMIFAILLAFILYPLANKLERWKLPRVPATILAMLITIVMLTGIGVLFASQFYALFAEYELFQKRFLDASNQLIKWTKEQPWLMNNMDELIAKGSNALLKTGQQVVSGTIVSGTVFLGYTGMVLVYVFLFLLYRTAFKQFVIARFNEKKQPEIEIMIRKAQKIVQHYVYGLLLSMFVLGSILSVALYAVGIPHAFLFGYFAALLTIIPYIGTTLGGLLPFFYALLHFGDWWHPVAVVIIYQLVQLLESNFITPKIVGSQVSINALVAIVVLIFGGLFWGIPGMVLSIPITALTKVMLETFEVTRPYAFLLSNEFSDHPEEKSDGQASFFAKAKQWFMFKKNKKEDNSGSLPS